jgi:hypothetical protein
VDVMRPNVYKGREASNESANQAEGPQNNLHEEKLVSSRAEVMRPRRGIRVRKAHNMWNDNEKK